MSKYALTCLAMTAVCVYGVFLTPHEMSGLIQASKAGVGIFGTLFILAMLIGRRIKFDPVLR
ncbi:hypothetical protein CXK93_10740 [Stutzerimonas decontaminans]|uniref:Uncharacterized protein n=2 Tax=Stutzerimonas TaxID=2901164 RepID=A0ABX4VX44_9GAMM|nr:PA3371 family protein [Stutzerimonas decontaminans]AHY43745.1 hypothetical protein UIB01_15150 [Stutzerimonas decontaminans]PNF84754.1 hypothetical protein CXK93_10740 [Stutzerimonas decontaminans]